MAKFRTNHPTGKKNNSGTIIKVGLFGAIISGLFFVFNQFVNSDSAGESLTDSTYYLPESSSGTVISNEHYTLSYSEEHEQAEWVAYRLTRAELEQPWLARMDDFREDPRISSGSATPDDYKHSGYDRGHLVPVADRAFSEEAMSETFYMSNISPQSRNFNGGIWRELEELTRTWAKQNESLYVVTGPILKLPVKGVIGDNGVSIPSAYFKVLLDLEGPQQKGIGFVLPNEVSYEPLFDYALTIDDVEEITGIDFFGELMPEEVESELESNVNIDLWPFSKQKFEKRTEKWNKQ
jgi:endonuclease G